MYITKSQSLSRDLQLLMVLLWCPRGLTPCCLLFTPHSANQGWHTGQRTSKGQQPDHSLILLHSEINTENFPQGYFPNLDLKRSIQYHTTAPYYPVHHGIVRAAVLDGSNLHAVFKTDTSVEWWCFKSVNQVWTVVQEAAEENSEVIWEEMWCR